MKYTLEVINQVCDKINLVDYVSQFTTLEIKKGEYWCCCPLPNHKEDTPSFSIKDNRYYCFGCGSKGNIINFYMNYHKKMFPQAMEELIKLANIDITQFEYSSILEFLRKINMKKSDKSIVEHTFLNENIMNQYSKEPIVEWLSEGILPEVLDKYNVRYDKLSNKIVFPIHDTEGRIIAIKGRTLYQNYASLGIPKYIYYQHIGSNDFLFGFWQNKNNIINTNECIIVEAEKGVLKLESWGFTNVLALSTRHINDSQLKLLLSLRCNLIFAFDKDVAECDIKKEVNKLAMFTNVSYLYDKNNLTTNKESPYDKTYDIWINLYNNRKILGAV